MALKKNREYTDKQLAFLDALFSDEAQGNVREAMRIAGYAETTKPHEVTSSLKDEIYEMTKEFIAGSVPRAAFAVTEIIESPAALGNREKLAASKDLLDRGGHKPKEQIEVEQESTVFYLPAKED